MDQDTLKLIEKKLGLKFNDQDLLRQALTHRSYTFESAKHRIMSNERLEFLGDAVLSLIVGDFIFRRFPKMEEGEMAKLRASLVNGEVLAELAKRLDLGRFLLLGLGAEKEGARKKTSLLANSFEALTGAIYLDQGLEMARRFILNTFKPLFFSRTAQLAAFDAKTNLQEISVKMLGQLPVYKLMAEEGPVHQRLYKVRVTIGRKVYGAGEGPSKKKAEQAAAEEALKRLRSKSSDQ